MKLSKFIFPAIILVVMIIAILNFKEYVENINSIKYNMEIFYNDCQKLSKDDANYKIYCEETVNKYTEYKKCENKNTAECKKIIHESLNIDSNKNVFNTFFENLTVLMFPMLSIMAILGAVYVISPYFSNSVFRNYLTRMSYSKYIKKIFKKTLKFSFVIPLFIVLTLFSTYLLTGSMDFTFFNYKYIITYFGNAFVGGLIFIELAIICTYGSKNFIVSFAKGFSVYCIFVVLYERFHGNLAFLNLFYVIEYAKNTTDLITTSVSGIALVIILGIVIKILYGNKERVLCNIEKCEVEYDNQYK